jgi:hypothetical protein
MNSAIELHDSECVAVEAGGDGTGSVLLDAYVHRSEGRPGWEAGEGGIQRVRMIFENMTVEGVIGNLPAYIYEGSLTTGDAVLDNMIEFPGSYPGKASFKVVLSEDARILTVSGTKMTLVVETEFRYVERFSPGNPQT